MAALALAESGDVVYSYHLLHQKFVQLDVQDSVED